jgi:protein phosphatase
MIRSGNEDNFYRDVNANRGLFIVADGMGGHAAGEVASEMAVETLARELQVMPDEQDDSRQARIAAALKLANRTIHERTVQETEKHGMGTTVSAMILKDGRYFIGQVGDSRVYLLREGELRQLTKDHSYVQEQVDAGVLTPEQARYHPYSNVITRCVGAGSEVQPDTLVGDVKAGDVFLLATDGLTGMVDDRRLFRLLSSRATPQRVVEALIAEANGRGGLDNNPPIVIHVLTVDEEKEGRGDGAGPASQGTRGPGD